MSNLQELIKYIKDQPESWPSDACHYAKEQGIIKDFDWIDNVHQTDGRWGPIKLHIIMVVMNTGETHHIGARVYEMSGNHEGEFELQDVFEVRKRVIESYEWQEI